MTAIPTVSRRDPLAITNAIPSLRKKLVETLREWRRRLRSRRDLMTLSDRDLWDMRLTRTDAEQEASKPFWRE
jgi:uncharacterized protein YjiS (DUF1127 family)